MNCLSCNYHITQCTFGFIWQHGLHSSFSLFTFYSVTHKMAYVPLIVVISIIIQHISHIIILFNNNTIIIIIHFIFLYYALTVKVMKMYCVCRMHAPLSLITMGFQGLIL